MVVKKKRKRKMTDKQRRAKILCIFSQYVRSGFKSFHEVSVSIDAEMTTVYASVAVDTRDDGIKCSCCKVEIAPDLGFEGFRRRALEVSKILKVILETILPARKVKRYIPAHRNTVRSGRPSG